NSPPVVFPARPPFAENTFRPQPIISSRQIDEAHLTKSSDQKVIRRVADSRRNSNDDVLPKDCAREIKIQRDVADALATAPYSVFVMRSDVIREDEIAIRWGTIRRDDRTGL